MDNIKQPEYSIYAKVSENTSLMDTRSYSFGCKFGKVKDVCRQYGIKYKKLDTCIEFTAPKLRLQLFIEKLHFARKQYSRSPF
jgi:hypothetical protein